MTMDFPAFLNTVVTMFAILVVGYILGKKDIISPVASKNLSKLIISIGQPALIINAITDKPFSWSNLKLALISLAFAFIMHGIMAVLSYFFCIKIKDMDERKITEFAMVFGNIGFLGIPVLSALFPENGAFVSSFFIVCFNILLWVIGLGIIARKREDIKLTAKKIFINKGTVPSIIGFVIFLIPAVLPSFKLPTFATSTVSYLASLCTPISMLIIGVLLSNRTVKQMFGSARVYFLCFFKLLVFPVLFCIVMKLLGFSDFWILFIAAVSAMPSASSTSMFAELYDTAPGFSAQCVGTSTLISLATMPFIIMLAQWITQLNFSIF